MVRLSQRGNEVGFSGGNVMRMDVSYFDLIGRQQPQNYGVLGEQPAYAETGSNPDLAVPANPIGRNTGRTPSSAARRCASRSRSTMSTAARCCGRATASCTTQADMAQRAGEMMINNIFDNADKNRVGDAGCPL